MYSTIPQTIPLPVPPLEYSVYFPDAGTKSPQGIEIPDILLLDDDTDLADTLKPLLESHNYAVTIARNGIEGLRETAAKDFGVIVCDMKMPTMPGDMFYLAVQKVKPHLCSRFLFLTGNGGDPRTNDFLQRSDGLVVFKPVPGEELLQMISLVLQRNARQPGRGA